jgi:predicted nucleic acid-binding protein
MTIPHERWLLDTNVWVFGLRRDSRFPACAELLERIGSFSVVIPRQLLKELNINLSEEESRDFYQLINQHPEIIEVNWEPASAPRVKFFEQRGCRKGDAVIAAHAEALGVKIIVSENRQFLRTLTDLPIRIISSEDALGRVASR